MRLAGVLLLATLAISCAGSNASGSPSATPAGPAELDPAVAIPSAFPSDFPLYAGARPVKVTYHSGGSAVWEVAWETLDDLAPVKAFYSAQLAQGTWAMSSEMSTRTQYVATFTHVTGVTWAGLLTADTTSKHGLTKISVVLTRSG